MCVIWLGEWQKSLEHDLVNYVVVVPVYRPKPTRTELYCLLQLKNLSIPHVVLVGPENLDIHEYQKWWPDIEIERFANRYFADIPSYNELMLSVDFYERFTSFAASMLLCQLDAFLIEDRVEEFCQLPFDYFGAPWKNGQLAYPNVKNPKILRLLGRRIYVGNGGFSLRKIAKTIDLLQRRARSARSWKLNEDAFFAYWGVVDEHFCSCPIDVASRFALETDPEYWINQNDSLSMGIHAFEKCNPDFYAQILEPKFLEIEKLMSKLEESC